MRSWAGLEVPEHRQGSPRQAAVSSLAQACDAVQVLGQAPGADVFEDMCQPCGEDAEGEAEGDDVGHFDWGGGFDDVV